jgi:hypothetical protein
MSPVMRGMKGMRRKGMRRMRRRGKKMMGRRRRKRGVWCRGREWM